MPFKIFYSWQSKTVQKFNRYFIKECIEEAIEELKKELKKTAPDFLLDMDTQDISGIPNIPMTIHEKIKDSDIYIGDLTFIFKPAEADTEGVAPMRLSVHRNLAT